MDLFADVEARLIPCTVPPTGGGSFPLSRVKPYVPTQEEERATQHSTRPLPRTRSALEGGRGNDSREELTLKSVSSIVSHLRDKCVMRGSNAIFCDVSCGDARVVLGAAEGSPTLSACLGLDADREAVVVGQVHASEFASVVWKGNRYVPKKEGDSQGGREVVIRVLQKDVESLESLSCVSHVFASCLDMESHTFLGHLLRLVAGASHLRYMAILYRKDSDDLAYDFVRRAASVTTRVHTFSQGGGSLLKTEGGETVHGSVIRVRSKVRKLARQLLKQYATVSPFSPSSGIDHLFDTA